MKVSHPFIASLFLLLLALIILLTVFFSQLQQQTQQHAAGSSSVYPANIEYNVNGYGVYNQSDLTNPNVGAVDIIMYWFDVETQQGVFNWAPMDNVMSAWAQHGKKFVIVARYIHNTGAGGTCSNNKYMPAWEIAKIPHMCTAAGAIVPDYFDPTFKSDLQNYVTAIAQHVAASPYKNNLLYVRIGVGTAAEGYPCLSCSSSDMQQLTSWGYSIPNWITWQEQMLSGYKNAFSFVPVIYPLGDSDIDPASGQQVQQVVGYWAAANGMGVGQQGLVDTPGYANGNIVKIMQYVRAHYPSVYIQFQTVAALTGAAQLQNDINIANNAGAFSVEWFVSDITNASYQSLFQQWQQMVNSRTGTISNTPSPSHAFTPTPTNPVGITNTPTPKITPTLIPTIPAGATGFTLTVCPHGLGNCGDNANPNSTGNSSPKHVQRTATLTFLNAQNQPVGTAQGTVSYTSSAGNFQGSINGNIPSGQYLARIQTDGSLPKQAPGIITFTQGQQITIPAVTLINGNINNDGQLDILDYNILISCFGSKQNTSSCTMSPTTRSAGADIDDDGTVNGADYNLFLRELSVQRG